ncbi:MAG: 50S ribosomal protein L24e [Candidatus Thermoplasmatota archaeon]
MVVQRSCNFCGRAIEPGTGKMFVKHDGTTYFFCTSKCQKNLMKLGRVSREVKWASG